MMKLGKHIETRRLFEVTEAVCRRARPVTLVFWNLSITILFPLLHTDFQMIRTSS
ncbi:unnamed protein product, partial [Gulo gulo]